MGLDGQGSGPGEVWELLSSPSPSGSGTTVYRSWMVVVQPVLRMKMCTYGGGGDEAGSIRFNPLAIAKARVCKFSDQPELSKRGRISLER